MDKTVRSICNNLVINDQSVRTKAFRTVRDLFKKNTVLDDLSLHKLCKGLYYSLWMTDDFILVHKMSLDIIQMYKLIKADSSKSLNNNTTTYNNTNCNTNNNTNSPNMKSFKSVDMNEVDSRLRYLRCLFESVSREWLMLDKNRVDKMLLFTRILVSEVLYYMNDLDWNLDALNKLSEIYLNPNVFNQNCLGLWIHFIQVYVNELVLNYDHLRNSTESSNTNTTTSSNNNDCKENDNTDSNSKNKTNKNLTNGSNSNTFHEIDGVKFLYIIKPFVAMFVNNKDQMVLKTIFMYVFKNLEKLSKITNINVIVHLLYLILKLSENKDNDNNDSNNMYNICFDTESLNVEVKGANRNHLKTTLKLYQDQLEVKLTEHETKHVQQVLCSLFTVPTLNNDNHFDNTNTDQNMDLDHQNDSDDDTSKNDDSDTFDDRNAFVNVSNDSCKENNSNLNNVNTMNLENNDHLLKSGFNGHLDECDSDLQFDRESDFDFDIGVGHNDDELLFNDHIPHFNNMLQQQQQQYQQYETMVDHGDQRDYINLSNVCLQRINRQRMRNLCILNNTKNYLILVKASDENSLNFMKKLQDPRIQNQLFYYSLIRLRRLRLMYRFKHDQLNKIYDFNKDFKSNFTINLQQALDNIKNIKPTKSSLMKHEKRSGTDPERTRRKKKKVVFNLKNNQVTNIPCRKKKACNALSLFNLM